MITVKDLIQFLLANTNLNDEVVFNEDCVFIYKDGAPIYCIEESDFEKNKKN